MKVEDVLTILSIISLLITIFTLYNTKKRSEFEEEKALEKVQKELKKEEEFNNIMCKSLLVLMDHEITNNNINRLKDMRQELNEFLINR